MMVLRLVILTLWCVLTIANAEKANCLQRAKILYKTCARHDDRREIASQLNRTLSVDLSDCQYTNVPPLYLGDNCVISELNLYNNKIKLFQNDSFKDQLEIRALNLSQNPFCYNTLPMALFSNMKSLKTLFLQPMFDHADPCLIMDPSQLKELTNLEHLHVYGHKSLSYLSPLKQLSWLNLGELDGRSNKVGCTLNNMTQLKPLMGLNISRLSIRWCAEFNLNGVQENQSTVFRSLTHIDASYNSIGNVSILTTLFGPRLRVLLLDALCNRKLYPSPCRTSPSEFNITAYSVDNYLYDNNYISRVLCGEKTFGEAFPYLRFLSTSELSIPDETDMTEFILNATKSKLRYLEYWRAYDLFTVQTRASCPVTLFQEPSFKIFEENDLDKLPTELKDDKRFVATSGEGFPMVQSVKTLDMPSNRKSILTACKFAHADHITMINQSFVLNQQKLNRALNCKDGYIGLESVRKYYCDNCAMEQPTRELKTAIDIEFVSRSYPNLEHLQLKSSVHQTFKPKPLGKLASLILDGASSPDYFAPVTSALTNQVPAAKVISLKGVKQVNIATITAIPENLTWFDLSSTDIKYLGAEQRSLLSNHSLKQPSFTLNLKSNGMLECNCNNKSLVNFVVWVNKSEFVKHTYTCNSEPKEIAKFLNICFPPATHYWYLFAIGGAVIVIIIFLFVWFGRHTKLFFKLKTKFYGCCCCLINQLPLDEREPNTFFLIFLESSRNSDMAMALTNYAKDHFQDLGIKAVSRIDAEPGTSLRFTTAQFIHNCRYAFVLLPRGNRFLAESQADIELLHAQHTPMETRIFAVTNSPPDYLCACVSDLDDLSKKSLELHNLPILPELPLDDKACQQFWEAVTLELRLDTLSSESGSTDGSFRGYNRF